MDLHPIQEKLTLKDIYCNRTDVFTLELPRRVKLAPFSLQESVAYYGLSSGLHW